MDYYFYINMLKNIISTFFQNGIWVVGFLYLLNKFFESKRLKIVSNYILVICLAILFVYSILVSL